MNEENFGFVALDGPGPFTLPLSDRIESIEAPTGSPFLVLRLRLTTGERLSIPLALALAEPLAQAAARLVEQMKAGEGPDPLQK